MRVDERAGRLRSTFLRRVKLGPKTSVPFSDSLARSDLREYLSTTEISNLWPYTTSYTQLKTQWEKLPEELGYLGIYYPSLNMAQKGRRTTRNRPSKGAHNNNNAIKGRDAGMINQSKGRLRKHLDGRTNPDRGSDAHQSEGRVSRNVISLHTPLLKTRRPRRGT